MQLQRHSTGLQALSRSVVYRNCQHPAASRLLRRPTPCATQQCRGARVVARVAAPSTTSVAPKQPKKDIEGPSTDPSVIYERLQRLVLPYWLECPSAKWRLAGVVALTLGTTAVSVTFNYLNRDFFNALAEKDVDRFQLQLLKYLVAFAFGIPVFVLKGYFQSRLALEWREWLTSKLLGQYFADRSFYQLQAGALVDNPDQRIAADVRNFTDTALGIALVILNSVVDLVSFSSILYSIYPPLFAALLAYSIGGTVGSVWLGKSLVGLNFNQEAVEANMRYGLVRVRENAESIAFYGGQANEMMALKERLSAVVANYGKLLIASRNLDFFTSFYRFLIQLLPAAVVAPLFFAGKIEFGVINQSSSAFNHILNDVSLVVYQFETLAGFSAVVDRLGEFQEVVDSKLRHTHPRVQKQRAAAANLAAATAAATAASIASADESQATDAEGSEDTAAQSSSRRQADPDSTASTAASSSATGIQVIQVLPWADAESAAAGGGSSGEVLLELDNVSINTPDGGLALVQALSLKVCAGESLLIMGPSGAGKTSVMRTLAGLWQSGSGSIYSYGLAGLGDPGVATGGSGGVLFLPQKPYMVLGSLRDQLLYPTWTRQGLQEADDSSSSNGSSRSGSSSNGSSNGNSEVTSSLEELRQAAATPAKEVPTDAELEAVLKQVQLHSLLDRCKAAAAAVAAVASSSDAAAAPGSSAAAQQAATTTPHAVLPDAAVATSSSTAAPAPASTAAAAAPATLASALDYVADWSGILSLGEQQRLAFARLLLAGPKLALLDEATSALDTKNEGLLYKALLASGTTVLSVGHRPTLIRYHQQVLQLASNTGGVPGRWKVVPAEQLLASSAELV